MHVYVRVCRCAYVCMYVCVHIFTYLAIQQHILDLTRLPPEVQVPDGKWSRKPLAYREFNNFIIYV